MKTYFRQAIPLILTLVAASAANAQALPSAKDNGFFHFHNADVGVAATGQFTTSVTDQVVDHLGNTLPHQATTDSPGVLFTMRGNPVPWAGIELNYQYSKFSENFFVTSPGSPTGNANREVSLATSFHEATAAYLFHPKMKKLAPYIGIGGGGLDFVPTVYYGNQWRLAGLVDLGLDMQTHSRLGFRVGARDLTYRAPNYNQSSLSSSRWVTTTQPYAGVYIKY
jgi:hypothetical protein